MKKKNDALTNLFIHWKNVGNEKGAEKAKANAKCSTFRSQQPTSLLKNAADINDVALGSEH